jgi:hypothetical protein
MKNFVKENWYRLAIGLSLLTISIGILIYLISLTNHPPLPPLPPPPPLGEIEKPVDISGYWKINESQRVFWNTSDIESNRGSMIDANATVFSIYNGFPVFTDYKNPFIRTGKLDAKIAKKLKKYKYRVINSPLTANPIVLLALYKEKVLNQDKSNTEAYKKYIDEFKSALYYPEKVGEMISNLLMMRERNFSIIQPQLKIDGKWYTLALKNDNIYYYPVDYETMINMIKKNDYSKVDKALEDKQINDIIK